jgi:hypothetical protein
MYETCRLFNSKLIKIGEVAKDIKNKRVSRYQNKARKYHDKDYEQANREVRDFIYELNDQNTRNTPLSLEVYIIGIGASIKEGNPDLALIEEAQRLADNSLTVLLRSLVVKILEFEVNPLNDIRVKDVLEDICWAKK